MMWEAGWNTIKENPWLGAGPSMAEKYHREMRHEPSVGVHNIYLHTWLNLGIIGLVGYLLWWLGSFGPE